MTILECFGGTTIFGNPRFHTDFSSTLPETKTFLSIGDLCLCVRMLCGNPEVLIDSNQIHLSSQIVNNIHPQTSTPLTSIPASRINPGLSWPCPWHHHNQQWQEYPTREQWLLHGKFDHHGWWWWRQPSSFSRLFFRPKKWENKKRERKNNSSLLFFSIWWLNPDLFEGEHVFVGDGLGDHDKKG